MINFPESRNLCRLFLVSMLFVVTACQHVYRKHSHQADPRYRDLTTRVGTSRPSMNPRLSVREARKDLDQLEWLIQNSFSYRDRKNVDYRAALDTIRIGIGPGINRFDLAYQINKFIALFGDGHSIVTDPDLKTINTRFLPFLVKESKGRLYAIRSDHSDFMDPRFPCVRSVDGQPIQVWLDASRKLSAQGSPQFTREGSIRNLRYLECLRAELKLPRRDDVSIELESTDTQHVRSMDLRTTTTCPLYEPSRATADASFRTIGEIGYLRIPVMTDKQQALDTIKTAMNQFKTTRGLIIDIRGNGGGTRDILRLLFPYFMPPQDKPHIVNMVRFRRNTPYIAVRAKSRYLYRRDSSTWTEAEREAIDQVMENFKPETELSPKEFGDWYFLIMNGSIDAKNVYYYDKSVVVLMNRECFSASDIFLGAFKDWPHITLMGTSSGGGSGGRVSYMLGESNIGLYLSGMVSFRNNGKMYDGNGIEPDILIEPEPGDLMGRTDTVLDAAVNYLEKRAIHPASSRPGA